MIYLAGLDLGQEQDPSALVIIQARGTMREVDDPRGARMVECMPLQMCDVRHIESLPLKMKYREQAALVERRLRAMPAPKYLALDQTGVGNAAIEFYHHMSPIGIKIHGGDGVTRVSDQQYHVPKRDLVM